MDRSRSPHSPSKHYAGKVVKDDSKRGLLFGLRGATPCDRTPTPMNGYYEVSKATTSIRLSSIQRKQLFFGLVEQTAGQADDGQLDVSAPAQQEPKVSEEDADGFKAPVFPCKSKDLAK